LGPTQLTAEVFVVDTEIPFLIGGSLLREHKTEISVSENKLTLNNHKIDLNLLPSGHMALKWTSDLHKTRAKDVYMTDKVPRKEWTSPPVVEAMEKELRNLQENGTYEEVKKEPWMVVIPSMWVVTKTTDDDGKNAGKVKARLVVRGDQDEAEDDIPCDSPTVDRNTVKLLIAIAAIMGWSLRSVDISAAFLQGKEIDRTVYILPPPECRKPGVVWKLRKGLYGLKEAARLWYEELTKDLEKRGGKPLVGDPACLIFHVDGKFVAFALIHVDDILIGGEEEFTNNLLMQIKERFRVSKDQIDKFVYTGMSVRSDDKLRIHLNQNQYSEELTEVHKDAEKDTEEKKKTTLRGVVGKLLYLNLTRPDLSFRTNILSRIPAGTNLDEKIKEARELVEEARRTPLEITYGQIGSLENLSLEVYADASFGGVEKGIRSTEGFIILLRGDDSRCAPIAWRSRVISRVCRSVKTAETIALEDALDMAIGIGRQVVQIQTGITQDIPIPIRAYTDSNSLVESLKSTKQVDEGPTRLNIARIKDHLKQQLVTEIKWVPTHLQLADPLTKTKADATALRKVLRTGFLEKPE